MITLLINPIAGSGFAKKTGEAIDKILTERGIEHETVWSKHPGHATELARDAAQRGVETVFSVGGDGTALETARGLIHTATALAIVPAGTGDDFIKTLGVPRKPMQAMEYYLAKAERKPVDTGLINGQAFLNVVGTGFDVSVLDYALKAKKYVRGLLPYLYGVICTILHFKAPVMEIEVDGKPLKEQKLLICAAGNGRFIGGGMKVVPKAEADDGLLDLTLMNMIPNWQMPVYAVRMLMGKILNFKVTTRLTCSMLTIRVKNAALRMNVDGEIIPMDEAHIRLEPSSLVMLR
ncbi:MAG: diacylglycerol kinase family lipid kinase [Eubacteriales bacterium]|nr:diacylglycerol kinase family lipid kinase [Eubacteriales bacterium]MDD3882865.1 diacylglycerol kinase family lipid kinase [Eubacteriales bacterium]MDD4512099.1 diacylglycerol kinase family lipid kinase [Eubacteriales bacterium]